MSEIPATQLSEVPVTESVCQLIIGLSGSGKTRYAGTAGSRTLYLNLGNGIRTLRSPEFQAKYNSNPYVVTVTEEMDVRGFPKTIVAFDNVADTIEKWMTDPEKLKLFDTIVIDDLTSLSQYAAYKAMELSGTYRNSQSLSAAQRRKHVPIKEQGDWGIEIDAMRYFLGNLVEDCKNKGKNLICIAHERQYFTATKKGADPILRLRGPMLAGKDAFAINVVPGLFDDVWYFKTVGSGGKLITKARTMPDAIDSLAKTRWGGVFKEIEENPVFLDVVARVHNSLKEMK